MKHKKAIESLFLNIILWTVLIIKLSAGNDKNKITMEITASLKYHFFFFNYSRVCNMCGVTISWLTDDALYCVSDICLIMWELN